MRYACGNTRTGKLIGICKGHTQGIGLLAFTPDGKTLVSVSSDSSLRFWSVSTQQELLAMKRIADPVQDLLFSPDGDWLILKTLTGLHLLNAAANPAP
jgi:WD40 repeat protein